MYGLYDKARLEKKGLFGKLPFERLYGLYKKLFEYYKVEYKFIPEKIPAYAGIFLTRGLASQEILGNATKIIAIIVLLIFCAYTILLMRPAPIVKRGRKKRNKLVRAFERGFLLGLNNLAINLDEIEHLQFLVRIAINLVLMYMML